MRGRSRTAAGSAAKPASALVILLLLAAPPASSQSVTTATAQSAAPARSQGATSPAAANWPSFRGPGASGVVDGPELPDEFDGVDGAGLLWRVEIPGMAHASPIVWQDRVYVTSAVSEGPPQRFLAELPDSRESVADPTPHRWIVMALDKRSGEVLWERTAAEGVPATGRLRKGSFNNSTPATDGQHVVALFGSQGLYCYDREGALLWQADLGVLDAGWFFDPTFQWGTASSPIIWENKVIVQADVRGGAFIAAFDIDNGRELWRAARDEVSSWGTPTVVSTAEGARVVTNGGRAIRAYDVDTGEQMWYLTPSSEIAVPTPIFASGLIFVGSGYVPTQPFYAIRPGGSGDISLQGGSRAGGQIAWSVADAGPLIATPIVVGDYLYVLGRDGTVHCFDAVTGIPIFAERIGADDSASSTEAAPVVNYTASPVASNGKLYFTTDAGDILVVEAGLFLRVESTHPVGEAVFATPAISEGMLIVRGQRHLFAFSR